MTPADETGRKKTSDATGGTSVLGNEPATPAVGASESPSASGIGVNDSLTAGSGPDIGQAAPGVSGAAASGTMAAGTTTIGTEDASSEKFARVKTEASKLRDQATDRARSAAVTGKQRASETIDGLAQTVHETAAKLEQQTSPQVARYAHQAADALDSLSATLRTKDVDELVDDARQLIRRSPAIAIGAAAAIGFALSRFLKASSERVDPGLRSRGPSAQGIDTGTGSYAQPRANGNGATSYNA